VSRAENDWYGLCSRKAHPKEVEGEAPAVAQGEKMKPRLGNREAEKADRKEKEAKKTRSVQRVRKGTLRLKG